jgi:hypothetical protein
MTDRGLEPERDGEDWTSFERQFRSAYDATPAGAPHIAMPPALRKDRARARRAAWLVGSLAAGVVFFLLVQPTMQRSARQPMSTTSCVATGTERRRALADANSHATRSS